MFKHYRFCAYIFLFAVMYFMCSVAYGVCATAYSKLLTEGGEIYWIKYPFEDNAEDNNASSTSSNSKIMAIFLRVKDRLSDYTSGKLPCRSFFADTAKMYEKALQWDIDAAQGKNIELTLHDGYTSLAIESRDVSANSASIIGLNKFCQSMDVDFLYMNLPYKICKSEDKEVSGVLDFSNQNADRLLRLIGKAGIKYYDLREFLHNENMKHHDAFFVTDVHWTPETGLWAAKHVLNILKDDYGWPVSPETLNPEKFKKVVYPREFGGIEGFTLIYPSEPVNIHYEIPNIGMKTSGDFGIMYDLQYAEDETKYPYHTYNYSIRPVKYIRNFTLPEAKNKKLLIIHDSFANSLIPFLALEIKSIDDLDLRSFTGSVRSYIKVHKPDAVIVCYAANMIGRDNSSSVSERLFDFR